MPQTVNTALKQSKFVKVYTYFCARAFEVHSTNHCALCHLVTGDHIYSFDCSASGVVLRQRYLFLIFFFLVIDNIFLLLCGALICVCLQPMTRLLTVSRMFKVYEVQAEVQ